MGVHRRRQLDERAAGSYQAGVAPTNCLFDADGNPYVPVVGGRPDLPLDARRRRDLRRRRDRQRDADHGRQRRRPAGRRHEPLLAALARHVDAHPGGCAPTKGLGFANYPLYKLAQGRTRPRLLRRHRRRQPAVPGDSPATTTSTGWGTPDVAQLMLDLDRPVDAGAQRRRRRRSPPTPTTTCGAALHRRVGRRRLTSIEGQSLGGARDAAPQLDILGAQMLLTPDGQTLRTIITVRNLTHGDPDRRRRERLQLHLDAQRHFSSSRSSRSSRAASCNAYDGAADPRLALRTATSSCTSTRASSRSARTERSRSTFRSRTCRALPPDRSCIRPSAASYVREGVLVGNARADRLGRPDERLRRGHLHGVN